MENQEVLKFTWKKGIKEVKPAHPMVQNWMFTEETEEQASLAHNGCKYKTLQHEC